MKSVNNSGFTLIELCVAIVIFAIGITGLAAMQIEALKGNSYSTSYNDGVNIAKNLIERQVADTVDSDDFDKLPHVNSSTGTVYAYRVKRTTQDIGGHSVKQLAVTVWWGRLLTKQHYSLTTVLDPASN